MDAHHIVFEQLDTIYRRTTIFLDPEVFKRLSVPLMRALKRVVAPMLLFADDKVIYAYVPEIIRHYLDEDPILPNVLDICAMEPKQMEYVLIGIFLNWLS